MIYKYILGRRERGVKQRREEMKRSGGEEIERGRERESGGETERRADHSVSGE